ncbi:hypothetical protein KEM55_006397 [Ascosphaera atra]|nr:hypothetical protein KEM55_006397 [Ascosphaera atra]
MFYVVLYPTSLWISKLSVLFFSRALVRGLSQYRVQFWSLFALVMSCYIAYMVTVFTPVNMPACYTNFNMTLLNHESHSLKIVWKIQTALDIISDLLAMVIPIYVLPNIQRNIYAKLSAFAMFALGFIIIIFSGVRLHVSLQGFDKEFPTVNSAVHILTWSQVQAAISSIVANLPAARGLWMYLRTERKKRSTSGKISYLTATLSSIVSGKTASYAGADRVAHALPLRPPPAIATRSHPGSKESLSKHGIALSPMLPPRTSIAQSRASSTDESSATLGPGTTVEQSQHKKIWKRSSICVTSNSLADSAGVGPDSSIGRGSDQRRRSLESAETSPAAWNEELKTNV